MNMEDYPMSDFENHVLTVIHEHEDVKRYQFRQPDTGCYGFNLTCADNLMVMTGDCYTLIIEPGYGRCGLAFLRGSIKSTSYFLSKCTLGENLTEYKLEYALEDMKEHLDSYYYSDDEDDIANKDKLWSDFKDQLHDNYSGAMGQMQYYEVCHDLDIEEPPDATRMSPTTKMQIAGLMTFVDAYNDLKKDAITHIDVKVVIGDTVEVTQNADS